MKIVVLDGYTLNPGDLSWKELEKIGELCVYDRTESFQIIDRIGNAAYVFTNKTSLGEDVFAACPNLQYIGVLATGYDIVDVVAAARHGIIVTNVPSYGTSAVSQFVFALLLELCHHVGHHAQRVADGAWATCKDFCFWDYPSKELYGKVMGIVGMGRIGYATAKIAQGFGMKVLAYDKLINEEWKNEGITYVSLKDLFSESDVVSLHCPLSKENIGMINKETISLMKDGAYLINTSRGPLIDEDALYDALEEGKLAGAGLDVLCIEPPSGHNRLSTHPNCLVTPHIAWSPKESRQRLMDVAVNNLRSYINGKTVNAVRSF
ncbi:MAG: D-2-hydroxyacid dehydrogenase [Spirochaetia bacterium]|jgi:glycerate dehydrogenase|nr:D-2-hydroxyacid dehydrogenase [Spirochaetia bacterium]